jgi:hypothetical protein
MSSRQRAIASERHSPAAGEWRDGCVDPVEDMAR